MQSYKNGIERRNITFLNWLEISKPCLVRELSGGVGKVMLIFALSVMTGTVPTLLKERGDVKADSSFC